MTDIIPIRRELLERANSLLCSYSSTLTDRAVTRRAISEICAILAAPRQPEGDAISRERVQAEADAFFDWPTADKSSVTTTSCLIFARCIAGMVAAERDATIAELRAEISDLHTTMMAAAVEIQEHWQAHCDEEGYGPANLMNRLERGIAAQYGYTAQTVVQIEAERDTLRQQRDRLAGLLRHASSVLGSQGWDALTHEIDAALAKFGGKP